MNEEEMKILQKKELKVGDTVKDHQHHTGKIKAILMTEEETPHPPKIVFEYHTKADPEGDLHEAKHNPSAVQKVHVKE